MGRKAMYLLLVLALIALPLVACAKPAPTPTPTPTPAPKPAPAPKETKGVKFSAGAGASLQPQVVGWMETIGKHAGKYVPYNVKPELSQTVSFIAGIKELTQGQADVDFSAEAFVWFLTHGAAMFKDFGAHPVRILAWGGEANVHIVTLDPNIKTVEDFKGKRVSAERPGAPTMLKLFELVLDIHGMKLDDVKVLSHVEVQDGMRQLKEGVADVVFTFTNRPSPAVQELAGIKKIYLIPLPDSTLNEVMKREQFRYKSVIPAGTYKGVDEDVPCIRNFSCMVTRTDFDEEMSYGMVKAVFENLEELYAYHPLNKLWTLKDITGAGFNAAPYNGGTIKYLKEKGEWNAEMDAKQKEAIEKLK